MKKLITKTVFVLAIVLLSFRAAPYKPGDVISDFSLKNVKGDMVSLSQFDNAKGFIVVFMCNTCPVVKAYEQRIMDLHNEFGSKGYPVIAVNSNDKGVSPGDSFEEMQKTAKNKNYAFQYLYDESQEVARKFGPTNTPHIYVLSKNENTLKVEYAGAIDNSSDDPSKADKKYVADAVNKLLNGEQVALNSTKAVGCGIKWKK